ncbi:sulfur carrier protein ThiS [Brevibacillus humidisoli]|uniref:sulfur carrier protein ThiS n=1 Tax=Brevibacillus humidisoli TaxID=2895522 RepID=UPI001E3F2305|nr:sulfur carrier protein ThiS [Brevibacillus humidisoli]UFJ42316.1 sulfur carrier protein ThiS [Brevibacillus humidisoli]
MHIRLNGEIVQLEKITTVSGLLAHYSLEQKILVVERNGQIVDRSAYEQTPIKDGDNIEIVHFVGGG